MIRDITPDDKAAFIMMMEKLYSSKAVVQKVDTHIFEETFHAAVNNSPYIRAFILEDDEMPVGYGLISFSFATEVGGLVVLLEDLYIADTCRGKGLGSQFFRFVEEEYPLAKRFRLEVTKENERAAALYSKLGYRVLDYVQMVKDV